MESKYLSFDMEGQTKSGKTNIWTVRSRMSGAILGKIHWFGRWRQYCFTPMTATVWNQDCLADIQQFLVEAMRERIK